MDEKGERRAELLSPARDLECGLAAFSCGADAVYAGAERFSARKKAGISFSDIGKLCRYGHKYYGRIYLALNTLLSDRELEEAVRTAERACHEGVDAVILQDMGLFSLLKERLAGIPLIASTQCFNADPDKVLFLEESGFDRVILERHLSLGAIRDIRAKTSVGLECFVHGSLCWAGSGRCGLSFSLGGRSGNRGECGQPCRLAWELSDTKGRIIGSRKHYLSLQDLDLSGRLEDLWNAGVDSFKIEGRLRGPEYVRNVTAYYREKMDRMLSRTAGRRSSSGMVLPGFIPDLSGTFRRGGNVLNLDGAQSGEDRFSFDSPKSRGEFAGRVLSCGKGRLVLDAEHDLRPGDGICWIGPDGGAEGSFVNRVEGREIGLSDGIGLSVGTEIRRNSSLAFLQTVKRARPQRLLGVRFSVRTEKERIVICVEDEDGRAVEKILETADWGEARSEGQREVWRRALEKTGGTDFQGEGVEFSGERIRFCAVSRLNALRRDLLAGLEEEREKTRPIWRRNPCRTSCGLWKRRVTPEEGVLNLKAEEFYRQAGSPAVEWAPEAGGAGKGRIAWSGVCFLKESGLCGVRGDFFLKSGKGEKVRIRPDCKLCGVEVFRD